MGPREWEIRGQEAVQGTYRNTKAGKANKVDRGAEQRAEE